MKSFKIISSYLVLLVVIASTYSEEDNCYWKPDGSQICENEETHNIWTEELHKDDDDTKSDKTSSKKDRKSSEDLLKYFKENGVEMERLELELVLHYVDNEKDGLIALSDFEIAMANTPIEIATKMLNSFSAIDTNDDGSLSKAEMQSVFQETSDKGEEDFLEKYSKDEITILDYMEIVSQMDSNFRAVLKPFKALDFLSFIEIKKVIEGSTKMFSTMDLDSSGGLDMAEYMKTMDNPDNKRSKMMGTEQKEAIFGVIDLNKDGEISYPEFQSVLPQKPKDMGKNLEQVFKTADLDSDGFLSEEEFGIHLTTMSAKTNGPPPTEVEVEEAFNKLDHNEDGKVSEEEMKGILGEIEKLQAEKSIQAFKEMDTDGDGQLSREEMETIAKVMGQRAGQNVDTDMLIAMLDKNSDGAIQLEEVQEMMKRMLPST